MKKIYLDYAATTPVDPEVKKFIQPYFDEIFGNSQSLHSIGQESYRLVETARNFIANMLNCQPEEVIFTSGGTESNNTAIKGVYFANRKSGGKHIITSTIEHHAVLEPVKFIVENFKDEGAYVTYVPVNSKGIVDVEKIFESISENTILISIMHANNEIGTIQPLKEIGEHLQKINKQREKENKPKIYFHTDAVQTFGHIKVDVEELKVDLLSASGHKFYAPKGVGFLYIRKGTKIEPLLHGGGHEFNLRSSTVNVSGIAGLYKAAQIAQDVINEENERIKRLRDKFLDGIISKIPDVVVNGDLNNRLVNNINICIRGVESEAVLLALDSEGICVSSGSACSSGSLEPSHVLLAIGIDPVVARGSLRFTLGRFTTEEEVDKVIEVLPKVVDKIRKISPIA
ncbi:MAG: cysteine desulfurase [Endomicrobia bacterium]|nr:cysteine desulfurase [Endomicrobiia bacterium]